MPTFKAGEIVQLKSGSPDLTVITQQMDMVICNWFDGATLLQGHFQAETLNKK
jgi:uncharacterized protein YodC (DUF2158 family)